MKTDFRFAGFLLLVSALAHAQGVDTNAVAIGTNRAESTIALPTARLLAWGAWEVSLGYRHDADVVRATVASGQLRGNALTQTTRWIDQRDVAWAQFAVAPLARLELDAALPVLLNQSTNAVAGVETPLAATPAVGDARFGVRFAVLEPLSSRAKGFQWSLAAGLSTPTGLKTAAFGERTARADLSTTATYQFGQGSAVNAHVGYQMGQSLLVGDQLLGDRVVAGASFAHRIADFRLSFDALTHVNTGAAPGSAPQRATLELVAGVRYVHQYFFVELGGGVAPIDSGLTPRGFGQLAFGARGFFFEPNKQPPDPDNDGLEREDDKCPTQAEDFDGFEDGDGCPDLDNDRDGILDPRDACPLAAEDKDGIQDADGCPETDADSDGVPDEKDACPLAPEDFDGYEDGDGCPEAGSVDTGARFKAFSLQQVTISFSLGSAQLDDNALAKIRDVARTLLSMKNPVTLVGHTDDSGDDARNLALSKQRSEAVRKVLVEAGISAERLSTRAAGKNEPLAQGGGFGDSLNRSVTIEWQQAQE